MLRKSVTKNSTCGPGILQNVDYGTWLYFTEAKYIISLVNRLYEKLAELVAVYKIYYI